MGKPVQLPLSLLLAFSLSAGVVVFNFLILSWPFIIPFLTTILIPIDQILVIGERTYTLPLLIIGYYAWFLTALRHKPKIRIASAPTLLFALWLLWGAVSFVRASNLDDVVQRMNFLTGFFLMFLLFQNLIQTTRHVQILTLGYFILSTVYSVFSALGYIFGWFQRAAIFSTQDPNGFALILGIALCMAPYLWMVYKTRWARLLISAGVALLVFAIIATGSRGAWAAIIASAVFSAFFASGLKLFRLRYLVMAALVLATLIVLLFSLGLISEYTQSRFESLSNPDSMQGRVPYWRVGLEMVKSNPLFGVGLGAFPSEFSQYVVAAGLQPSRDLIGRDAHNTLLSVLAELGIPGFVIVCLFYWVLFRDLYRYRTDPKAALGILLLSLMFFGGMTLTIQYKKFFWFPINMAALIPLVIKHENT